jgi:hypothetical protein
MWFIRNPFQSKDAHSWVWWPTLVIPALRKLRQEDVSLRPDWAT